MGKKIVVFADGTGNAFTTQESNVWRLYQALDQSQPDQIARYIRGVGTAGFRPFAMLDGATGIGVPSNVRKLYRFICWNWQPGDDIYMFGFSRGAFTIRTLIGLIDKEGLVPARIGDEPVSHAEMQRNAMASWRAYRARTVPWRKTLPTIWMARTLRDAFLAIYDRVCRRSSYEAVRRGTVAQKRQTIAIKFAGLFDTVEAFGVPIEELRSAIDWAIWPISFRNQRLSDGVECVRHALSLDDERTSFHPLRFEITPKSAARIREVWFAGVHSDVGGGYPDDALAHVPLVWIAEEAEKHGLRLVPGALGGFRARASAFGPLHDSREGLAVMYRYDPRRIAEDEASGGPPVIHHAVAEKMVFGSENYAPITLPSTARVLMPDGSTFAIQGFSREEFAERVGGAAPQMAREKAEKMPSAVEAIHRLRAPDKALVSLTRDTIWWRRVAYFLLLFSTLLAASLPLTAEQIAWTKLERANAGIGTPLHSISKTIGRFLPGYATWWLAAAVTSPVTVGMVLLSVLLLYQLNGTLRDCIADRARHAWFLAAADAASKDGGSGRPMTAEPGALMTCARFMRKSAVAGWVYRATSGFLMPGFALALIFAGAIVTMSRTTVSYRAGHGDLCKPTPGRVVTPLGETPIVVEGFAIEDPCWASGVALEKGRHYTIWMDMVEPFFDQTIMTDIAGFRDFSWRHLLALPIRRWWAADWFQPIARVGTLGDAEWPLQAVDGAEALEVGLDADGKPRPIHFQDATKYQELRAALPGDDARVDVSRLSPCQKIPQAVLPVAQTIHGQQKFRLTYVSQFVAPATGELFLYVNDAIAAVPFGPTSYCFYGNNTGRARVTIGKTLVPKPGSAATTPAG